MEVELKGLILQLTPERVCRLKDLKIKSGEKVLISGPSGCGKTTLLHALGQLRAISAGEISYDGHVKVHADSSFRRQKLGFIFQRLSLIDHLTAEENILLDQVDAVDAKIFVQLKLNDVQHEVVAKLSVGEQQRIAVARALHKQPVLLLADTEFGNDFMLHII